MVSQYFPVQDVFWHPNSCVLCCAVLIPLLEFKTQKRLACNTLTSFYLYLTDMDVNMRQKPGRNMKSRCEHTMKISLLWTVVYD